MMVDGTVVPGLIASLLGDQYVRLLTSKVKIAVLISPRKCRYDKFSGSSAITFVRSK